MGIHVRQRIVIFGAGDVGKRAYGALSRNYDVIAYSDNNEALHDKVVYGCRVIAPEEIELLDPDMIVIAMLRYIQAGRGLVEKGYKKIYVLNFSDNGFEVDKYELKPFTYRTLYSDCRIKPVDCVHSEKDKKKCRKRKNVLMVSYAFPPEGGPAVQRTLKFVKYLGEFGYLPVILTCGKDGKYMVDSSLESEIPENVKVVRIDAPPRIVWEDLICREQELFDCFYFASGSEEFMERLEKVQECCAGHLLPDEKMLWVINCIREMDDVIDMADIDFIYTTAPPFSVNILGEYLKKKYCIPWIADYRDLWTSNDDYNRLYNPAVTRDEIELFRLLEGLLLKHADHVVVAGENWEKDFTERFGVSEDCISTITNGYDEEDFETLTYHSIYNDMFTLCYNGAMRYKNRNPVWLIQLINALIREGSISREDICWIINGKISNDFNRLIDETDIYHFVKRNGMVSHKESINVTMSSDLLIFFGEKGTDGRLNYPGKFYEYLRFGRKILSFSGEGSFQDAVLKETGRGVNFDYDEKESIADFIKDEYGKWKRHSQEFPAYGNKGIERFERRYLTKELARILMLSI